MNQGFGTNIELVDSLIERKALKTKSITDAFLKVDRMNFLREGQLAMAYYDGALPTLSGQTISQPFTVAFMFELLQPKPGDKILNVGSGSGWTVALLAEIVGEEGSVTGTEIVPELVEHGKQNLAKFDYINAEIIQADKDYLGVKGEKFDKILVDASSLKLPRELLDQLEKDGTMVIPIGDSIVKVNFEKDGRIREEAYPGFLFVPLQ